MQERVLIILVAIGACSDGSFPSTPDADLYLSGTPTVERDTLDEDDFPFDSGSNRSTASSTTGESNESTSITAGDPQDSTGQDASPDLSCIDLDVGSALGTVVAEASTDGQVDSLPTGVCAPLAAEAIRPDYVLAWTAPATRNYVISVVSTDPYADPALRASSGSCDSAALLCNDDCVTDDPAIVLSATAGELYLLSVESADEAPITFNIVIREGTDSGCMPD